MKVVCSEGRSVSFVCVRAKFFLTLLHFRNERLLVFTKNVRFPLTKKPCIISKSSNLSSKYVFCPCCLESPVICIVLCFMSPRTIISGNDNCNFLGDIRLFLCSATIVGCWIQSSSGFYIPFDFIGFSSKSEEENM